MDAEGEIKIVEAETDGGGVYDIGGVLIGAGANEDLGIDAGDVEACAGAGEAEVAVEFEDVGDGERDVVAGDLNEADAAAGDLSRGEVEVYRLAIEGEGLADGYGVFVQAQGHHRRESEAGNAEQGDAAGDETGLQGPIAVEDGGAIHQLQADAVGTGAVTDEDLDVVADDDLNGGAVGQGAGLEAEVALDADAGEADGQIVGDDTLVNTGVEVDRAEHACDGDGGVGVVDLELDVGIEREGTEAASGLEGEHAGGAGRGDDKETAGVTDVKGGAAGAIAGEGEADVGHGEDDDAAAGAVGGLFEAEVAAQVEAEQGDVERGGEDADEGTGAEV